MNGKTGFIARSAQVDLLGLCLVVGGLHGLEALLGDTDFYWAKDGGRERGRLRALGSCLKFSIGAGFGNKPGRRPASEGVGPIGLMGPMALVADTCWLDSEVGFGLVC